MVRKVRIQQISVLENVTEATPQDMATVATAANSAFLPVEKGVFTPDPDLFDRGIYRQNLTNAPDTPGIKSGRFTCTLEITATGTGVASPQFHQMLRACGMTAVVLTKVLFDGGVTGSSDKVVRHGTTVTQGANVFKTFMDTVLPASPSAGSTILWCGRQEALGLGSTALSAASDLTLSGLTSGTIETADIASCTASAGVGYMPRSDAITKLLFDATGNTASVAEGDVLKGNTSGATAVVYSALAATANGAVFVEKDQGLFTAGETITNVTTADTDIGVLAASGHETQTSIPTIDIAFNEDGNISLLGACRGNAVFVFENGRPGKINFEFLGSYQTSTERTLITSGISFAQRTPPTFLNTSLRLGPYNSDDTHADQLAAAEVDACVSRLEVNLGNSLALRPCSNASSGVKGAIITSREPKITFDAEQMSETAFGLRAKMMAGSMVRAHWSLGANLGMPDLYNFSCPAIQFDSMPSGDREGILTWDASGNLTCGPQDTTTGDNEFVFIHPVL